MLFLAKAIPIILSLNTFLIEKVIILIDARTMVYISIDIIFLSFLKKIYPGTSLESWVCLAGVSVLGP